MNNLLLNADWESWQKVADGTLKIEDHLPISRLSYFGDNKWSFADPYKPRTLNKAKHTLEVDWHLYEDKLSPELLHSVKVLGFFLVHHPAIFTASRRTAKEGLAPTYCCQLIKVALTFLSEVYKQASFTEGITSVENSFVQTIYDVTLADIQNAFVQWKTKSLVEALRRVLCAFTSPLIQKYLPGLKSDGVGLNWYAHDIETLDLPTGKKSEPGQSDMYRDKPIPDDLLQFMTAKATGDVLNFLIQLDKIPVTSIGNMDKCNLFDKFNSVFYVDEGIRFKDAFEEYLLVCSERYVGAKYDEYNKCTVRFSNNTHINSFRAKFRVNVADVRNVIERVHSAAKYLLLQFTGVRYSEAALLKKDCVELLPTGDFIMKGTVSKGRSINLLTGLDCWVACPIVIDAISVLEELTRFTQSDYLFASSRPSGAHKNRDKSVSVSAVNNMLTTYLYNVDSSRNYSFPEAPTTAIYKGVKLPYRISTHRLRHTIALHMSRAGVGIPYISLHLKHVYQAHKRFQSVQDVTLNYGGIGNDIFHNAVGIRQANRELTDSIYHPQSPVAGPGAEQFKKKRTFYFAGMLAAGWQEEDILEHLSARGLPLADVGLGYCKGQRPFEEDGEKHLPPCLGQLECNPSRCKNAVIPKIKSPMWVSVYKESLKRINDPLLAHAKPKNLRIMSEAEEVLRTLGVDIVSL